MSWRTELAGLRRVAPARLALAVEAAVALGLARLAVTMLPFRLSLRRFDLTPAALDANGDPDDAPGVDPALVEQVRWSISAAAARLPGTSTCLVRALAAARMMRRRELPASLYLGVALDPGTRSLAAHAWLTSGSLFVTGARERPLYRPIAAFRTVPGR